MVRVMFFVFQCVYIIVHGNDDQVHERDLLHHDSHFIQTQCVYVSLIKNKLFG